MARQKGPYYHEGTVAHITFYKLWDRYYLRMKSSIDGKRIKEDPAFVGFRASSELLKQAAPLASKLYWMLPANERVHGVFGHVTANVKQMLKDGLTPEQITTSWTEWLEKEQLKPAAKKHFTKAERKKNTIKKIRKKRAS